MPATITYFSSIDKKNNKVMEELPSSEIGNRFKFKYTLLYDIPNEVVFLKKTSSMLSVKKLLQAILPGINLKFPTISVYTNKAVISLELENIKNKIFSLVNQDSHLGHGVCAAEDLTKDIMFHYIGKVRILERGTPVDKTFLTYSH